MHISFVTSVMCSYRNSALGCKEAFSKELGQFLLQSKSQTFARLLHGRLSTA